jgi:hypothetical protein
LLLIEQIKIARILCNKRNHHTSKPQYLVVMSCLQNQHRDSSRTNPNQAKHVVQVVGAMIKCQLTAVVDSGLPLLFFVLPLSVCYSTIVTKGIIFRLHVVHTSLRDYAVVEPKGRHQAINQKEMLARLGLASNIILAGAFDEQALS